MLFEVQMAPIASDKVSMQCSHQEGSVHCLLEPKTHAKPNQRSQAGGLKDCIAIALRML